MSTEEWTRRLRLVWVFAVISLLFGTVPAEAQAAPALDQDTRAKIDQVAREALASTGVPSASIAVVKDGKIAYLQAYGEARLEPRVAARPEMRYSIGSISKQFTAAAMLMLQEEGKLSLDDKVSRFLPNLTRAAEVTIRELLSHTSGYQDYWPQDYVPPFMLQPITAEQIMDRWARKALDFDPGTQWQYSNTNYVIAGVIIEKASGMPLMQFLQSKIFAPLGMQSVANIDLNKLGDTDPTAYLRYALGPPRVAPKEGKGWLFAAGELAMTAADLAKWDISLMDEKLLKPASYRQMETDTLLKNGLPTGYGLGLDVRQQGGHRVLEHGGEVSGFTAENVVFPDDRAALAVLTNQDSANASGLIVRRVAPLLLPAQRAETATKTQQARAIFEGLQHGKIDRSRFTENANSYFTEQALQDFAGSLSALGAIESFTPTGQQERGGMTFRGYRVKFSQKSVSIWERDMPDGKIEQFQVMAAE